jgi:deazaflavin-dependent oxidoreductase (nitroreductase family)
MVMQNATGHVQGHRVVSPPALLRDRRAWLPRLVFRAPVLLYRLGLGGLFGHQFLLVRHAGRRTGQVRETVLKVLRYDPSTGESIVASAWGTRTDWYRNVQAGGCLSVSTGGIKYVPEMRAVSADEAFAVFDEWTRRQRWFADLMLGQIGLSWDVPDTERRAIVAAFPFLGFRWASRVATDQVMDSHHEAALVETVELTRQRSVGRQRS